MPEVAIGVWAWFRDWSVLPPKSRRAVLQGICKVHELLDYKEIRTTENDTHGSNRGGL